MPGVFGNRALAVGTQALPVPAARVCECLGSGPPTRMALLGAGGRAAHDAQGQTLGQGSAEV